MAKCWPIQVSATQKAVLISLADQANDDGVCWPSVGSITVRCCLGERTVRRAIIDLESLGLLTTERPPGKSTTYTLTTAAAAPLPERHPCRNGTRPLPERHHTPARAAGDPCQSGTPYIDPSINRKGTIIEPSVVIPENVDADTWAEFVEHRKSIGKKLTKLGAQKNLNILAALSPTQQRQVVDATIANNWTGLFPPKGNANGKQESPLDRVVRAYREETGQSV